MRGTDWRHAREIDDAPGRSSQEKLAKNLIAPIVLTLIKLQCSTDYQSQNILLNILLALND